MERIVWYGIIVIGAAVAAAVVMAFLRAEVPLLFCRAGRHKWEVPPFATWFMGLPQFKPYEQCTRIGCWKTRDIQPMI